MAVGRDGDAVTRDSR